MIAAGSFLLLFILNEYQETETSVNFLALSVACLLLSYRTSRQYKIKNSPMSLIERREGHLAISRLKISPFSKKSSLVMIEIQRISEMTIGDNCLSIIIDGNGNGYDFQLVGTNEEINSRLNSLLIDEIAGVSVKQLTD